MKILNWVDLKYKYLLHQLQSPKLENNPLYIIKDITGTHIIRTWYHSSLLNDSFSLES